MAFSALAPMASAPAEARHRGRGVAIGAGIVLGVTAAALLANSRRAHADDGYYHESRRSAFWETCRKWYRQCEDGSNYACEKYETRGCTE
jgi:hypothetical protein